MRKTNDIFEKRLAKHMDELRWLYMELYDNEAMFAELCEQMKNYYQARNAKLRKRDLEKEKDQAWYRKKNMLGMMLYIDNFAGNLRGVKGKLKYLEECGVNCVHLMPFLDSPKGRSDGGYAVADFRKVKPEDAPVTIAIFISGSPFSCDYFRLCTLRMDFFFCGLDEDSPLSFPVNAGFVFLCPAFEFL